MSASPVAGIRLLEDCHALRSMLPSLPNGRFSQPSLRALQHATDNEGSGAVRFAVLLNELSTADIEQCCQNWRVPTEYRELSLLLKRLHDSFLALAHESLSSAGATEAQLGCLEAADAFRRPERFADLLTAMRSLDSDDSAVSRLCKRLLTALTITRHVKLSTEETQSLSGPAIGQALREKRLTILQEQGAA
jgi:hypothetical protein